MKLLSLIIALLFSAYLFTTVEVQADPSAKNSPPGWQKGDKDSDKDGWDKDRRNRHEKSHKYKDKNKERPQGWDSGKKEGWSSDTPPGQEGKQRRDPRTKEWKEINNRLPWLE
ncbi:hypothetical protein Ga0123462_0437 [Mariprofundus ferrinatatus]|uniref:Uncharacterized protein n=1 Tax=Mariprofundus ferrinatatus TaxID=1921087 RepID=A0A2K8L2I5_9PROT|nr:hypothetical protein [Mariprofundus ferrinatatus]ATX81312.1 hypothetical protein Ga0123462_0437 [Mariprofundus ferrinatatus]